jgi:hypothetical protein
MPLEVWVNNCRKAKLQITQVQELVIDLTEHEQEMIFGSGQYNGRDDAWCFGVLNSSLQKSATLSNFKITIDGLN